MDSVSIKKKEYMELGGTNSGSIEEELERKEYEVDLTQYIYEYKIKNV